jgi:transcriptional regulator with XRE-family HTH domain
MIDPESLDLKLLPWLPLESKADLPEQPAIYFAINSQGIIQYIGRSQNLKQRWAGHHKFDELTQIGDIKIAYLFVEADLLAEVEKALIEWFKPSLNTVGVVPIKNIERKESQVLSKLLKDTRGIESQRSFAERIGVALAALQGWEDGRSMPETENLFKIAAICNMDFVKLCELIQGYEFPKAGSVEHICEVIKYLPQKKRMQLLKDLTYSLIEDFQESDKKLKETEEKLKECEEKLIKISRIAEVKIKLNIKTEGSCPT